MPPRSQDASPNSDREFADLEQSVWTWQDHFAAALSAHVPPQRREGAPDLWLEKIQEAQVSIARIAHMLRILSPESQSVVPYWSGIRGVRLELDQFTDPNAEVQNPTDLRILTRAVWYLTQIEGKVIRFFERVEDNRTLVSAPGQVDESSAPSAAANSNHRDAFTPRSRAGVQIATDFTHWRATFSQLHTRHLSFLIREGQRGVLDDGEPDARLAEIDRVIALLNQLLEMLARLKAHAVDIFVQSEVVQQTLNTISRIVLTIENAAGDVEEIYYDDAWAQFEHLRKQLMFFFEGAQADSHPGEQPLPRGYLLALPR